MYMKSVVVCGSKKYKDEIKQFCHKLQELGAMVYEPNIYEPIKEDTFIQSENITRAIFKGFTLEHFDWIRKADVCFIYDKDNYVGVSVTMEMAFASAISKPIYALNRKTGDPCRDSLVDKEISTPEELFKLLK